MNKPPFNKRPARMLGHARESARERELPGAILDGLGEALIAACGGRQDLTQQLLTVVRRHGGHLGVESAVGTGTTFTIYLPASRRQPPMEPSTTEAGRRGEGRVLVMDDEAMIRGMAGDLLGYLGYEVDFAASGEEAIRKYEEAFRVGPYRLVIMNLTVPGGKEAVRRVLDLDPAARVLASSGFAGDPVMADFERYGFSGALIKPYNLKELVRTINRLLGEKEPHPTPG